MRHPAIFRVFDDALDEGLELLLLLGAGEPSRTHVGVKGLKVGDVDVRLLLLCVGRRSPAPCS